MREMATASRAAAWQAKLTADNAATAARVLQPGYVAAQALATQTPRQHQERSDRSGKYYRAPVISGLATRAVATLMMAASLRAVKAEGEPQICVVEHDFEERSPITMMVMLLLGLLLAIRGAVALAQDFRKVPSPSPQLLRPLCKESKPPIGQNEKSGTYLINVPMQIMICKKTGSKYHAVSCCEVGQARGRHVGVYMPCEKCIDALRAPFVNGGIGASG